MRKHNYFGHPLMQLCFDLGTLSEKIFPQYGTVDTIVYTLTLNSPRQLFNSLGEKIHDLTLLEERSPE